MASMLHAIDAYFWPASWLASRERLVTCRWLAGRPGTALLAATKFISFGYLFGNEVWEWCCKEFGAGEYISYLTYLGMWIVIMYMLFSCTACVATLMLPSVADKPAANNAWSRLAWEHLFRGTQVLLDISVSWQMLIVILYWGAIFATPWSTSEEWYRDINQHVVTCVLVLIDLALTRARLPDPHVLIPFFAGIVYLLWNLGYTLTIRPLYKILKWNDGTSAALAIGSLALIVITFFLGSAMTMGWDALARRASSGNPHASIAIVYDDEPTSRPCASCVCCPCYAKPADAKPSADIERTTDAQPSYGATDAAVPAEPAGAPRALPV